MPGGGARPLSIRCLHSLTNELLWVAEFGIFNAYSIVKTNEFDLSLVYPADSARALYFGVDTMKLSLHQFTSASGWDTEPDPAVDSPQTLLLFFASPDKEAVCDVLHSLRSCFARSIMFGCSSAGEIYHEEINDQSVSLAMVQFDQTPVRLAVEELTDQTSSVDVGANLARQLLQDDLKAVMVLSDGLLVNGSKLVEGLSKSLPGVVITGGLAGDADRFEQTWVWADGAMKSGHVCAVGFYGDRIGFGHGSRGGWDILGPEREVTRADANVLYELDGQPALQLYKSISVIGPTDYPQPACCFRWRSEMKRRSMAIR